MEKPYKIMYYAKFGNNTLAFKTNIDRTNWLQYKKSGSETIFRSSTSDHYDEVNRIDHEHIYAFNACYNPYYVVTQKK